MMAGDVSPVAMFLSVPGTLIFIDRPQHVGYLSNKIAEYVLESQYSIKR